MINDHNQAARCDRSRFDSKWWICINMGKEDEKKKRTSDVDMTDLEGEEEMEGKGFGEKSLLLSHNPSYLIKSILINTIYEVGLGVLYMLNTLIISKNKERKEGRKDGRKELLELIYIGFYCNWRWWCNCWPLRFEKWWVVLHLSYKDGDDILKRLEGAWWRWVRRRRGKDLTISQWKVMVSTTTRCVSSLLTWSAVRGDQASSITLTTTH